MWRMCVNIVVFTCTITAFSQQAKAVHWLTFEQLSDSIQKQPKKVLIDFYADWCAPCLKMQRDVFTDEKIIRELNENYYAVKMNVESRDTMYFGNQKFVNKRSKRRNSVHEIPLLMASQKGKPFSLPALVFLDENFKATARYFQYLNVEQFLDIISSSN